MRLSSPWRQAPPGSRPRVNRAHPLARDLMFAVIYNNGCHDLTTPAATTLLLTGVTRGIGAAGVGYTCGGSATSHIEFGTPSKFEFTNTTSWTYFSVFANSGVAADRMFPTTRDSGQGTRKLAQWRILSTQKLSMVFGDAGLVLGAVTGDTAIATGENEPITAAGVRDVDNDEVRVYLNGIIDGTAADASTGTWTVNTGIVGAGLINVSGTSSFPSSNTHFLDLVWTRALSSEEIAVMHHSPYQLFEWDEPDPLSALPAEIAGLATGTYYYYH